MGGELEKAAVSAPVRVDVEKGTGSMERCSRNAICLADGLPAEFSEFSMLRPTTLVGGDAILLIGVWLGKAI